MPHTKQNSKKTAGSITPCKLPAPQRVTQLCHQSISVVLHLTNDIDGTSNPVGDLNNVWEKDQDGNEWCYMCQDGGTMFVHCNSCPRVVCSKCVELPPDLWPSADGALFECPSCHIVRGRKLEIKEPYMGFYKVNADGARADALLKTPLRITGQFSLGDSSQGQDISGGPARMAKEFLEGYIKGPSFVFVEQGFNLTLDVNEDQFANNMKTLAKDLSKRIFACLLFFVTTHANGNLGDIFIAPNLTAEWMNTFFSKAMAPCMKGAAVFLLACGSLIKILESFIALQEKVTQFDLASLWAFTAGRFQPNTLVPFVVTYCQRVLIEGRKPLSVIASLLGAAGQLNLHTDISQGPLSLGQELPAQCPAYGCIKTWSEPSNGLLGWSITFTCISGAGACKTKGAQVTFSPLVGYRFVEVSTSCCITLRDSQLADSDSMAQSHTPARAILNLSPLTYHVSADAMIGTWGSLSRGTLLISFSSTQTIQSINSLFSPKFAMMADWSQVFKSVLNASQDNYLEGNFEDRQVILKSLKDSITKDPRFEEATVYWPEHGIREGYASGWGARQRQKKIRGQASRQSKGQCKSAPKDVNKYAKKFTLQDVVQRLFKQELKDFNEDKGHNRKDWYQLYSKNLLIWMTDIMTYNQCQQAEAGLKEWNQNEAPKEEKAYCFGYSMAKCGMGKHLAKFAGEVERTLGAHIIVLTWARHEFPVDNDSNGSMALISKEAKIAVNEDNYPILPSRGDMDLEDCKSTILCPLSSCCVALALRELKAVVESGEEGVENDPIITSSALGITDLNHMQAVMNNLIKWGTMTLASMGISITHEAGEDGPENRKGGPSGNGELGGIDRNVGNGDGVMNAEGGASSEGDKSVIGGDNGNGGDGSAAGNAEGRPGNEGDKGAVGGDKGNSGDGNGDGTMSTEGRPSGEGAPVVGKDNGGVEQERERSDHREGDNMRMRGEHRT
ncbi:hypothetical protein BV22DRAFT_1050807 [Leucogyrophana mollusca]|uniref:Uncharacterized protein n=1 Tax=Leucogyrophana mollusca TaxID=85980 RepID=A0ACB8B1W2_9AGAM|nr:hypothetical protein BV22DRAFT_1050807 [Leucogyrophana mollusca]